MRVLFAGTPEIAVPSLEAVAREHEVVGVLTNPDRTAGRGRKTAPNPVKETALRLGLEPLQPDRLDPPFRELVRRFAPEILVVVAYGKIFGPKFLSLFPRGGVNLHPSLLPKYRGPSPITAAILAGDTETGITIQRVASEMDAGDILLQTRIPLGGSETTASLSVTAAHEGAVLLASALRGIEAGTIEPVPQLHEEATYCRLVTKDDGIIDWNRNVEEIERTIRAYDPWPRAHTTCNGHGLLIHEGSVYSDLVDVPSGGVKRRPGEVLGLDKKKGILVQTGRGVLAVTRLQLETKKPLEWRAFLNGVPNFTGTVLGGETA